MFPPCRIPACFFRSLILIPSDRSSLSFSKEVRFARLSAKNAKVHEDSLVYHLRTSTVASTSSPSSSPSSEPLCNNSPHLCSPYFRSPRCSTTYSLPHSPTTIITQHPTHPLHRPRSHHHLGPMQVQAPLLAAPKFGVEDEVHAREARSEAEEQE